MPQVCWEVFKVRYRMLSQIHLGHFPFGFIKQTRYYIAGTALWGAITAQLTRSLFNKADYKRYDQVGNFVREHIRTSYGYIYHDSKPLWPDVVDSNFTYSGFTESEFEVNYLSSYGRTAINPAEMSSESGALYEIETLSKYHLANKNMDWQPIEWQFYIYFKRPLPDNFKEHSSEEILDKLKFLTVGGERNYGLGLLKNTHIEKEEKQEQSLKIRPSDYGSNGTLRAHLIIPKENIPIGFGNFEVIPYRLWDPQKGPGQKTIIRRFIAPGSQIAQEGFTPTLGQYGYWEIPE